MCTEGGSLCSFMCISVEQLLFNILNSLCRIRCSIVRVDLSLIVFYSGVGAAKNGVWLTEPIFLIFVRGHIQIAHTPPVPPPPPPCSSVAPAHCVAMRCRSLGDSKILTAFNSKKRFFNEFKDLEDLEYWFRIGSPPQKSPESCLIFKHIPLDRRSVYLSP